MIPLCTNPWVPVPPAPMMHLPPPCVSQGEEESRQTAVTNLSSGKKKQRECRYRISSAAFPLVMRTYLSHRRYFFQAKELLRAWSLLPDEERNDDLETRLGQTILRSAVLVAFAEFTRAVCDTLEELYKSQCHRDVTRGTPTAKRTRKLAVLEALNPRGDVKRAVTAKDVLFVQLISPFLGKIGTTTTKLLDAAYIDIEDPVVRKAQRDRFDAAMSWTEDERTFVKSVIELRGDIAHGKPVKMDFDSTRHVCATLAAIAQKFRSDLAAASETGAIADRTLPMCVGKREFVVWT